MGLLDDAIREHLELKRRRGADPSEIDRQESEALGPVRREAAAAEAADGPHADAEPAGLEEPGAAYADDVRADVDRPHLADPPTTHEHAYAETEAESATPPHGDPYQPTREFSSEELEAALGSSSRERGGDDVGAVSASAAAEEAEAADELEETPEFLQETPEHDRLWFEQKPPKDFDF